MTHPRLSVADFDDGLVLPQIPDDAARGERRRHDVLNLRNTREAMTSDAATVKAVKT